MNMHPINIQDFSWAEALKDNLTALADALTGQLPPWDVPSQTFRGEDYGAVADGQTLNTPAIQAAIDACAVAGGGVVLFAEGNYLTGTIELKSGAMLDVAEGAKILGSTRLADYPEHIEAFRSIMSVYYEFRQSLIYAERAENIGIRGKGEIYFQGERAHFSGPQTTGKIEGRPLGIRMVACKHIVLQDILLRNSAAWMQNYILCEDLIFDGITVINHANYNNDGLDPDGCRNVIVRNCMINAEDDAMCLKGGSGRPSENILIENSTFITTCNAFKIGTDTQGAFRNIIARNLILGGIPDELETSHGKRECSTGITIVTVDGGDVENVYLSNVTIHQARCPIFLRVARRGRVLPEAEPFTPGAVKHILIEDVRGERNYRQGSLISGIAGYPVQDVVIRNMNLAMIGGGEAAMIDAPVEEKETGYPDAQGFSRTGLPAYGFFIRHAQHILLDQVRITPQSPDARPEFTSGGDVSHVMVNGESLD